MQHVQHANCKFITLQLKSNTANMLYIMTKMWEILSQSIET